jgi:hypothetical protein
MAQIIQIPDSPNSIQEVSLNAKQFTLRFRWNTIADAWSMDIHLGEVALRTGMGFKSDRDFTSKYLELTQELNGFFYCERVSNDSSTTLNRNSFVEGTHRILFIS